MSVYDHILYYLDDDGCEYELLEHERIHTALEASQTRGTALGDAAKALVLEGRKNDERFFFMAVVSGDKKLDFTKLKRLLNAQDVKMASPAAVKDVTGLDIGTIPPLPFLFSIKGYVDEGVLSREHIIFSAATHHHSVRMKPLDWLRIAGAHPADLAQD